MLVIEYDLISTMMENYIYYIFKNNDCLLKKCALVMFVKCNGIIWNMIYANGLCISIFIKDTLWYLGVIVKLHNNECLIYIFIVEVLYGTPKMFTNYQHYTSSH